MKKILMFSQMQDLDGMGCVYLGTHAFKDDLFLYSLCRTFDIDKQFLEYYDEDDLDKYDLVFINGLCLSGELLERVNNDPKIRNKIHILDFHKSSLENGYDQYDFVDIVHENNGYLECGTSLFYKYLLAFKYIETSTFLDDFVDLTRQYAVWEWKEKDNKRARKLNILAEELGIEAYLRVIDSMSKIFEVVKFDEYAQTVIEKYEKNLTKELKIAHETIKSVVLNVKDNSYKVGFVKIPFKLRNEMVDYMIDINEPIAALGMIISDGNTVSYRAIKDGVDCRKIASLFNGHGEKYAGSNAKDDPKFIEFYNKYLV